MAKTPKHEWFNARLRKEARRENREFRPVTRKQADEAERLNCGLEMLAGEDQDEIEPTDESD